MKERETICGEFRVCHRSFELGICCLNYSFVCRKAHSEKEEKTKIFMIMRNYCHLASSDVEEKDDELSF